MAINLSRVATGAMNINAGHESTSKPAFYNKSNQLEVQKSTAL